MCHSTTTTVTNATDATNYDLPWRVASSRNKKKLEPWMFLCFRFQDDQFFYGSCILVQPLMQRHKKSQTKYSPND